MKVPAIPADEENRLNAFSKYQLLDLANQKIFNQITAIASIICDVPISLITVIDKNKQWFLSHHGLKDIVETPRNLSFCAHAIHDSKLMQVKDATKDDRFHDNPYVLGNPHIRFYAGMPLVDSEGFKLGTLCIIDRKPRELTERQVKILKLLSHMIITIFETRTGILNDLNTLLNNEAHVSEMESFKNMLIQSIPEGIMVVDKNGKILFANEKANNIFGYSHIEFLEKNLYSLLNGKEVNLAKDSTIVTQGIKKDQNEFTIEICASPLKESKHFILIIKENNAITQSTNSSYHKKDLM